MANTVYYLQDSLSTTNLGGGTGVEITTFTQSSFTNAIGVAQAISTCLQRSLQVQQLLGNLGTGLTTYIVYPSTSLLVSALPSGTSF